MENMEFSKLKYPEMREELISHLLALSNREYQKNIWVNGLAIKNVSHDEFSYAVHFLFDDTSLASDPESCIGWFIQDVNESNAINVVIATLNSLFEIYGTNLDDAEYIEKPEWDAVVEAAKTAFDLFKGRKA